MNENTDYQKLITDMQNSLRIKLKAKDVNYIDEETLREEIFDAIDAVNGRRRFKPTSLIPFETQYSRLIVNLAVASITKYGAEGETAHSENGINRSYDNASQYPESLLSTVIPLGRAW